MLWSEQSEIPNMLTTLWIMSILLARTSSIQFKFKLFFYGIAGCFSIFCRVHTTAKFWNHSKTCYCFQYLLCKNNFQHLESLHPSLKQNLMQTCCSFKSVIHIYLHIHTHNSRFTDPLFEQSRIEGEID